MGVVSRLGHTSKGLAEAKQQGAKCSCVGVVVEQILARCRERTSASGTKESHG